MNLDQSPNNPYRALFIVLSQFLIFAAGFIFWSALCALVTSPAWLPGLIGMLYK
ncbi:MAG: hypothetical protein M1281_12610 [Chloroflexi bacterium]|nr:hypothetical protein [Chloroflexota bacterium]